LSVRPLADGVERRSTAKKKKKNDQWQSRAKERDMEAKQGGICIELQDLSCWKKTVFYYKLSFGHIGGVCGVVGRITKGRREKRAAKYNDSTRRTALSRAHDENPNPKTQP
jgi:hypothetical protein